jgi:mannan endo-1,4-beta-mannosidase
MFRKHFLIVSLLIGCLCFLQSCENFQEEITTTPTTTTQGYAINNGLITYNGNATQLIGVNALHTFSVGSSDLTTWNLDITREFIGNVSENPLTGSPILDTNNQYLYSLQNIVNDNRANGLVTILCPFGWDGTSANLFTGKSPATTFWWSNYKTILQQWATHFKDQNDVWIEVWNEPYNYNRTDGYTDQLWLNNMNELYQIIRNTNNNIVLIPCAEQGQDESVLINVGTSFLATKTNVLFDVHAYEKWLLTATENINTRLQALKSNNLPVIFGETAPMNAGVLMNPASFLNAVHDNGLSICAWLWKYDENDQDALLTTTGLPNNNNNNNWGNTFKNVALKNRNPTN